MWRRARSHLQSLAPWRSRSLYRLRPHPNGETLSNRVLLTSSARLFSTESGELLVLRSGSGLSSIRFDLNFFFVLVVFGLDKGSLKKKVEDVMPIATGLERQELEAELEVFFLLLLCFFFSKFFFPILFDFSCLCFD